MTEGRTAGNLQRGPAFKGTMTGIPWPAGIRIALLLDAVSAAAAQEPKAGPYEFGLNPDFGVGLLAAVFPRDRVGIAAEVGGFANKWRSSSPSPDGQETNAVQFAVAGPRDLSGGRALFALVAKP